MRSIYFCVWELFVIAGCLAWLFSVWIDKGADFHEKFWTSLVVLFIASGCVVLMFNL